MSAHWPVNGPITDPTIRPNADTGVRRDSDRANGSLVAKRRVSCSEIPQSQIASLRGGDPRTIDFERIECPACGGAVCARRWLIAIGRMVATRLGAARNLDVINPPRQVPSCSCCPCLRSSCPTSLFPLRFPDRSWPRPFPCRLRHPWPRHPPLCPDQRQPCRGAT